jgi:uncharacterized protein YuzE
MNYDIESNILSIELAKGAISNTKEFGNFIIHLSSVGKPILVEILNASKFISQANKIKNIEIMQKSKIKMENAV